MVETTTETQAWRVVDRLRLRLNRLLYDAFFVAMVHDESWQEPLIASLAPAPNNWILDFGPVDVGIKSLGVILQTNSRFHA